MSVKNKECYSQQDGIIGFVENHLGVHSFRVTRITSKYGKRYLARFDSMAFEEITSGLFCDGREIIWQFL